MQTKFNEKKSGISYDTYGKLKEELSGIETIVNSGIKETIEDYKNDAYKAIERVFKDLLLVANEHDNNRIK